MKKNNLDKLNYKLKIVDNFFHQSDYEEILNLDINKNVKKSFNFYHNEVNNNGVIKSTLDENFVLKLHKNYHDKAINILNEINKDKVELYDYSDFSIIVTNKDSKFPIHDDTPNKLLSGVIYLSPEENKGTYFYNDKKGSGKTYADWKPNKGVFFSRKERETWHSYEGDGKNNRIVLVYNLMTHRIKEVYKAEKKNYFLGNLRWKMNPYLYKYFNFNI
ncbi:hypothetical protein IDH12_04540 [Pelagibacterales bacterium SAG-MED29]|nr:hypothetical protein [Pelagibacterales bacterium SAG-MED29]